MVSSKATKVGRRPPSSSLQTPRRSHSLLSQPGRCQAQGGPHPMTAGCRLCPGPRGAPSRQHQGCPQGGRGARACSSSWNMGSILRTAARPFRGRALWVGAGLGLRGWQPAPGPLTPALCWGLGPGQDRGLGAAGELRPLRESGWVLRPAAVPGPWQVWTTARSLGHPSPPDSPGVSQGTPATSWPVLHLHLQTSPTAPARLTAHTHTAPLSPASQNIRTIHSQDTLLPLPDALHSVPLLTQQMLPLQAQGTTSRKPSLMSRSWYPCHTHIQVTPSPSLARSTHLRRH